MSLKIQAPLSVIQNNAVSSTSTQPVTAQTALSTVSAKPDSFKSSLIRFSATSPYTYTPDKNIFADLKKRADENPDDIALAMDTVGEAGAIALKLTNKELYDNSLRIGQALKEKFNLKQGDRIGVVETNSPEFVQLLFGAMSVGVSMAAINTLALADALTSGPKLAHMVEVPDVKVLFVGKDPLFNSFEKLKPAQSDLVNGTYKGTNRFFQYCPKPISAFIPSLKKARQTLEANLALKTFMLQRAEQGMQIITAKSANNFDSMLQSAPLKEEEAQLNPNPDSEAMVIYTSGTTSNPKAVPLTHQNLVHHVESLKALLGDRISNKDKFYMVLPLFHIFGMAVFLLGLSAKAKVLVLSSLKNALKKEKPKKENQALAALKKLLFLPSRPQEAKGLKKTSPILETIKREKVTVLPIIPGILDGLLKDENAAKFLDSLRYIVSGGNKLTSDTRQKAQKAAPNMQTLDGYGSSETGILTLSLEQESGHVGKRISPDIHLEVRNQDAEGVGELWLKSPSAATSYIGGTPEQNAELFKGDGWVKAEDRCKFDDKGNLQIRGRDANVVKSVFGGEKISTEEIDDFLKDSLRIKKALSIPFTPQGGEVEVPLSVVLLDPSSTDTEASLREALQKKVASQAFPRSHVPAYIIPIRAKDMPDGFTSIAGKTLFKAVVAYVKKLEQDGVVKLGKNTEILKPEVLGFTPGGAAPRPRRSITAWLNPLNWFKS